MGRFEGSGNYFREYAARTGDRELHKWEHYLDIYPKLVGHLQGKDISFLEIGVWKGGSIDMWRGYFGKDARLTFLDIDPACKDLALPGTVVEIGDQADQEFLSVMADRRGPFDLIVDDGGHKMHQQINSFRALWPRLNDGGLYVVEDVHTSYWPGFGGGYRKKGSFIEFAKDLIDRMNSWYTDQDDIFPVSPLASQIGSVRFYDSMVVVEKTLKEPPVSLTAKNGVIKASRKALTVRKRQSIF